MSFQILAMTIEQVQPITATNASVLVKFQTGGIQSDAVVQIYAHNMREEVGGLQDLATTVQLSAQTFQYDVRVDGLQAGGAYIISLCPRTLTDGEPDDTFEGQYWETCCVARSIMTRSSPASPGNTRPPPVITSVVAEPATLTADGTITVTWQAPVTYDKFLIWWTEFGVPNRQGEVETKATSGSWTAAHTKPGRPYTFAVNGGVSTVWDYKYSGWGPTVHVSGATNLRSLRGYLQHSGLSPDGQRARTFMPSGGSLRAFMKL